VTEVESDNDRNTEVLVRANVPAMRLELDSHRRQLITLDGARRSAAVESRKAASRRSTIWKSAWDVAKPIIVAGMLALIAYLWHIVLLLQSLHR
jgi:hypothetical protein